MVVNTENIGLGLGLVSDATQEGSNDKSRNILDSDSIRALVEISNLLEPERQALLALRLERQKRYDKGALPSYDFGHPASRENWQVAEIPKDLLERRVEITGPANSAKMVIQMLNQTPDGAIADMAMIDFEDSMNPTWENVVQAVHNVIGVAEGTLSYTQVGVVGQSPDKTYKLNPKRMAHPMVRVRGLHLNESHLTLSDRPLSASIVDLVLVSLHTARTFLSKGKTPKFYVPKCEHHLEARWWNKLFQEIEKRMDVPRGTLKVTFLIETLPAAFQMEEILYEIRERACGLNGGRWDKIFSDIKVLRNHSDRVMGDRASITMKAPWMENYVKRMIKICHKHGAFAMGGMSAFTPGKTEELRTAQTLKVVEDKSREASIGHDGCWVSHPYFIRIAREQFKKQNQLEVSLVDFPDHPDLIPKAVGPKTLQGLRTNIRVGIAYLQGWNQGMGCVAFDNLMEDLATLEISRAQTWQWLHSKVGLDDGTLVTKELIQGVFIEERDKIIEEFCKIEPTLSESYTKAAQQAENIFLKPELANFFSETISN